MCVICYKGAGVALPARANLDQCFRRNPDGAGMAFIDGKRVRISKGYFDFNEFYADAFKAAEDGRGVLMHFRIGTHGKVCPELTHPFPVVGSVEKMREKDIACGLAMAHNGVLDLPSEDNISDSMTLARIFHETQLPNKSYENETWQEIMKKLIKGSRVALMWADGRVRLFGEGWVKDNEVYYSNESYKVWVSKHKRVTGYAKTTDRNITVIGLHELEQAEVDDLIKGKCGMCRKKTRKFPDLQYCLDCDIYWPIPEKDFKASPAPPPVKQTLYYPLKDDKDKCVACNGTGKDSRGWYCHPCCGVGYRNGGPMVNRAAQGSEKDRVLAGWCPKCFGKLYGTDGFTCWTCNIYWSVG